MCNMADPTTAERLSLYYAAEAQLLQGQEARVDIEGTGPIVWRGADLAAVQKTIRELETKLRSEQRQAAGQAGIGGLGMAVARLDGC